MAGSYPKGYVVGRANDVPSATFLRNCVSRWAMAYSAENLHRQAGSHWASPGWQESHGNGTAVGNRVTDRRCHPRSTPKSGHRSTPQNHSRQCVGTRRRQRLLFRYRTIVEAMAAIEASIGSL